MFTPPGWRASSKSKIVNLNREQRRRFVFDLGVDPETDLADARRVGLAAMPSCHSCSTSPPSPLGSRTWATAP
jgi:hypothetical protein